MTEDHVDDVLRRVWTAQPTPAGTPPLNVLKRKARRGRLQFAIRNGVEYLAVMSVVVMASARALGDGSLLFRLGNLLLAAGMVYVIAQLHARASARRPPADGTATDYMLFLRLELSRQARALNTVWRWYLLPFVPGMVVINVASALEEPGWGWLVRLGVFAALLVGAHYLNRVAAARLSRRLANLEAAVHEDGTGPGASSRHGPGGDGV